MTTIYASTQDQELVATILPKVSQNNVDAVKLHVTFDSAWDAMPARSAVFTTSKSVRPYEVVLSSDGMCLVPFEVLTEECRLYIVVRGSNSATGATKSSTRLTVRVLAGAPLVVVSDPSPSIYQQLAAENALLRARQSALESAGTVEGSEVIGIRTDIYGNTYGNAGDAVRAQAELLNEEQRLMSAVGRSSFTPYAKWRNGGLLNATPNSAKYRIYTDNILHFDRAISINIAEGFRIGVHTVTSDGTFVADSGWRQEEYAIPAGTYFKMVVSRVTEDTTKVAPIAEFSRALTFDSYTNRAIGALSTAINGHEAILLSTVADKDQVVFKGTYYTTGGPGNQNNRINATDIVCDVCAQITVADPSADFYYGVDLFTNDGRRVSISQSGWMQASKVPVFTVEQNCLVHLSVTRPDQTSFTDLSEMDGMLEVSVFKKKDTNANTKRRKCWVTSAHRGFVDGVLKENSLAAYYNAAQNGADMIETDARLSSDGVLIANHDPTVTAKNANGQQVTYTIASTPSSTLCSLILSEDAKWGTQYVPTLSQVLELAYHTGLQVNIDIKDGYTAAKAVAKLVLAHGMQGKVVYALNGSGMKAINAIMAIDPDARFIDGVGFLAAVADFAERGKRCYAYTSDLSAETVNTIRAGGCMVALISLNASNFETAIALHPDMCEYLHTSDFRAIEDAYFKTKKLY